MLNGTSNVLHYDNIHSNIEVLQHCNINCNPLLQHGYMHGNRLFSGVLWSREHRHCDFMVVKTMQVNISQIVCTLPTVFHLSVKQDAAHGVLTVFTGPLAPCISSNTDGSVGLGLGTAGLYDP